MSHDDIEPKDYDGGAAIMVERDDSGCYTIPNSAEVESWDRVLEAVADLDDRPRVVEVGPLKGWGIWIEVWALKYADGRDTHYFRAKPSW